MTHLPLHRNGSNSKVRITHATGSTKCRVSQRNDKTQVTLVKSTAHFTLLVGWLEFNVPFQHKYGFIRDKRSRVESYPYPVNKATNLLKVKVKS